MKLPFHSIRWRLQLWHALISLSLIVAVCLLAYRMAAEERQRQIDRSLFGFERFFFRQLFLEAAERKDDSPPKSAELRSALLALRDADPLPARFRGVFDAGEPYLGFWDSDGTLLFLSPNAPPGLRKPTFAPDDDLELVTSGHLRELHHRHGPGIALAVGRDMGDELAALGRFRLFLALGGGGLLLAALAGGWWLAGRALKPIDAISHTANRIAAGNLDERIAIAESDSELDQLARILNDTFGRLADAVERQKRFTADASHELRTPLTIILSETQRGLKREREPADYQQLLSHCQTAAQRMRGLVDSLLILAREDQPDDRCTRVPCDLAEIANRLADRMEPLAAGHGTLIHRKLQPAPIDGDPELLDTLVQNLLSNALSHPPPGTAVTIRTGVRDDRVELEVHDAGPGIPPEHLPKIFDRFYRIDRARTQGSGHSGLGLAIVRSIADSSGGTIEVESSPGQGTRFRVRFPRSRNGERGQNRTL
ncbi:sensor histidine kinase [Luteolibacter marinus]|uniref:sensor histidine kinase n=1 Tax=Luteolibacter marinus TaxID=2776705 RepID=UPI0018660DEF|nr:ATP-binding protein [Luteolibacter marinus]